MDPVLGDVQPRAPFASNLSLEEQTYRPDHLAVAQRLAADELPSTRRIATCLPNPGVSSVSADHSLSPPRDPLNERPNGRTTRQRHPFALRDLFSLDGAGSG